MCKTGIFPIVPSKTNYPRRNPIPYMWKIFHGLFHTWMNKPTRNKSTGNNVTKKTKQPTPETCNKKIHDHSLEPNGHSWQVLEHFWKYVNHGKIIITKTCRWIFYTWPRLCERCLCQAKYCARSRDCFDAAWANITSKKLQPHWPTAKLN